jgi:hypothetical protein
LRLESRPFIERNSMNEVVAVANRDFVVPADLSTNTIAVALLRRHCGTPLIGLDEDDLPAAQCFTGSSALWVTPAWRIPREYTHLDAARAWIEQRILEQYACKVHTCSELGGRYYPSAGITPELVYPLFACVRQLEGGSRKLVWVALHELVENIHRIQDGHLRIVALRAAHGLGLGPR